MRLTECIMYLLICFPVVHQLMLMLERATVARKHMLCWHLQTEVRSEFGHIRNAPFSSCLPFLSPLSRKIIGYKTSVKSHSFRPSIPACPDRPSSHNKTPLNLISGALNVVDRRRRFRSLSHNLCRCNSHWPPPSWLTSFFMFPSAVLKFSAHIFCCTPKSVLWHQYKVKLKWLVEVKQM